MRYSVVLLLTTVMMLSCSKSDDQPWVLTKDIAVTAYKSDPENGKQYLDMIYENTGPETIRMLKIELLERTGSKVDTVVREISPEKLVHPKDRHLAKRPIGEPVATFDEVTIGRVWIVKE